MKVVISLNESEVRRLLAYAYYTRGWYCLDESEMRALIITDEPEKYADVRHVVEQTARRQVSTSLEQMSTELSRKAYAWADRQIARFSRLRS